MAQYDSMNLNFIVKIIRTAVSHRVPDDEELDGTCSYNNIKNCSCDD
jgi:hypothetical protein